MKFKTIPTLSKTKPIQKSLTGSIRKKKFSKPTSGVLKNIVKITDEFEVVKFGKNPTGISCSKEPVRPAKKTNAKSLKEKSELVKPAKKKNSSKSLKEINELTTPTKKTKNKALKEINESKYKVPKNLVEIKKSKKPVVSPKQKKLKKERINGKKKVSLKSKVLNPSLTTEVGDDEQSGVKPKLDITKVEAAVNALFTLVKEGPSSTKIELWDEATPVHLVITGVKFGTGPKRVIRIALPNSLITDTTDICLIVPDLVRGRNVDHEKTYHHYKDLLAQNDIKNIKTILPARQVRVEFNEYEARRKLCHSHDVFLIDQKISAFMVKKLGKEFYIKRKHPIIVKLTKKYLKSEIESKLHKTSFFLDNKGTTKTVQVGHMKQTPKQVAENILATFDNLSHSYPGGLNNIRVMLIKSPTSESLPIYFSMVSRNDVKSSPYIKSQHIKNENVEGELFGKRVLVKPNGDVKLLSGSEEESDYDADFVFTKKKIVKSDDGNDEEAEQSESSLNQDNEEVFSTKKCSESFKAGIESDDGDNGDADDDDAEAEYLMEFAQTKKLQKKKKTNKKEGLKSEKPDTETDGNNADSKFEPTSKLQPKEIKLNRKRQGKAIDNVKSEESKKIIKSAKAKNKSVIKKKKFNMNTI